MPTNTYPLSELRLQLIHPSTSPNELNTTLTPHSMIHVLPLLQQNLGHPLTVRAYATGSIGFAFRQFAMVRPARCGYPLPQSAAP